MAWDLIASKNLVLSFALELLSEVPIRTRWQDLQHFRLTKAVLSQYPRAKSLGQETEASSQPSACVGFTGENRPGSTFVSHLNLSFSGQLDMQAIDSPKIQNLVKDSILTLIKNEALTRGHVEIKIWLITPAVGRRLMPQAVQRTQARVHFSINVPSVMDVDSIFTTLQQTDKTTVSDAIGEKLHADPQLKQLTGAIEVKEMAEPAMRRDVLVKVIVDVESTTVESTASNESLSNLEFTNTSNESLSNFEFTNTSNQSLNDYSDDRPASGATQVSLIASLAVVVLVVQ